MLYALVAFDTLYKPYKIRFVWSDNTWSEYDYTEDIHVLCYALLDLLGFVYHSYWSPYGDYHEEQYINPEYLYDRRVVENLRI